MATHVARNSSRTDNLPGARSDSELFPTLEDYIGAPGGCGAAMMAAFVLCTPLGRGLDFVAAMLVILASPLVPKAALAARRESEAVLPD